ncbi:helix-turn-helix domain-containing protein [Nocardiopsis sp. NPDC055824]
MDSETLWVPRYAHTRERAKYAATLYLSGTPVHEIARRLQVSEKTVYRYLGPGKLMLKAELEALKATYEAETARTGKPIRRTS